MPFVIAPLAIGSCLTPAGKGPQAEAGYRAAAPIIAAIDRFHHDRGHYPSKLADLSPNYMHDSDLGRRFGYTRKEDSYTLEFTYIGPGVNRCWYDSRTKKWQADGYL